MRATFIHHCRWRLAARLILGGAFIYAGILKLRSPLEFADDIAAYQLLPAFAITLFALGLPFFEVTCGLLVLVGFQTRAGAMGISIMLLMFMGASVVALIKDLHIDCGCFGDSSWWVSNLWIALTRDGLLLVLAMLLWLWQVPNELCTPSVALKLPTKRKPGFLHAR